MKQLRIIGILILMLTCSLTWGQSGKGRTPTPSTVKVTKESISVDLIKITGVNNKSGYDIKLGYNSGPNDKPQSIVIKAKDDLIGEPIYCTNYWIHYTPDLQPEWSEEVETLGWTIADTKALYLKNNPTPETPKPEVKQETPDNKPATTVKEKKPSKRKKKS